MYDVHAHGERQTKGLVSFGGGELEWGGAQKESNCGVSSVDTHPLIHTKVFGYIYT